MTTQEAADILRKHNEWRRGGEGDMGDPTEIGVAIDTILASMEEWRLERMRMKMVISLLKN